MTSDARQQGTKSDADRFELRTSVGGEQPTAFRTRGRNEEKGTYDCLSTNHISSSEG